MTVAQLIRKYLAALAGRGARVDTIRCQAQHLVRLLGKRQVGLLASGDLEGYRMARSKERTPRGQPPAPATINRELTYLRAAMRRAVDDGDIPKCPRFRMSPEPTTRTDWWTADDFSRVVDQLRQRDRVLADLIAWYYWTGWRRREGLGLLWSDVDRARGTVLLPPERSKSHKPRVVPITGEVAAILDRMQALRLPYCPWVFHRNGRQRKEFRRALEWAKRAAGVDPRLTVHGLRRTFATNQMRAGVDPGLTMRLGGWSSTEMLERYRQLDAATLEGAAEQMRQFLEPQPPPGKPKKKKKKLP